MNVLFWSVLGGAEHIYIYLYLHIYKDDMLILESNSCINKQCLQLQALGLAQQPPPRDCEGEGHRGSEGRVAT